MSGFFIRGNAALNLNVGEQREEVTMGNYLCVGLKRKGLVCGVQVKGKH